MTPMRKLAGAIAVTAAVSLTAAASPAEAQTKQDGLVNVAIGDITILEDVNIAAAVDAAVQACDVVDASVVAAILSTATLVDQTSRSRTICRLDDGDKVRFTQN